MATLYELKDQYYQLMELAEEEDSATFQDTLESLQEEINEKANNIAFVIRNLKADVQMLKDEEKRLKERRTTIENKIDHLKWYLQSELEGLGIDKLKSAHFTISVRNNPPKVQVIDENLIPDDYFITKRELNKSELKKALKGNEIDGAVLIQEKGLNIR